MKMDGCFASLLFLRHQNNIEEAASVAELGECCWNACSSHDWAKHSSTKNCIKEAASVAQVENVIGMTELIKITL
ncbi:Monopolar spindle protein 2 [Frankliniella fusca]|uniref:Monopolar spindle protein 2 n=1 Tax=Frankliniella fusca TaxID=407009 RepID=A0AAE1GVR4_9NEOP|nr:Monopolar spindle protein 2 [Frankliniella fusca]